MISLLICATVSISDQLDSLLMEYYDAFDARSPVMLTIEETLLSQEESLAQRLSDRLASGKDASRGIEIATLMLGARTTNRVAVSKSLASQTDSLRLNFATSVHGLTILVKSLASDAESQEIDSLVPSLGPVVRGGVGELSSFRSVASVTSKETRGRILEYELQLRMDAFIRSGARPSPNDCRGLKTSVHAGLGSAPEKFGRFETIVAVLCSSQ